MTASVQDPQTSTDPHPEAVSAAEPLPEPAPARPKRTWTHTVAGHTAAVSAKLSPLARRGADRVAAASPLTLLLALLGLFAAMSMVAALALDNTLGVASTVLFLPALSAAIGAVAVRSFDDRRKSQALLDEALREESHVQQLERTIDYVDAKLTTALTQFGSERHNDAVIAMFQAKAITEFHHGTGAQPRLESALGVETDTPAALRQGERTERAGLSLI